MCCLPKGRGFPRHRTPQWALRRLFTNEREHGLGLHRPPRPKCRREDFPRFAGNAGWFLAPPRSHDPLSKPLALPVHTRSPAGDSRLLQDRPALVTPVPGAPPGGSPRGPQAELTGSRCRALARDTPPLPRNGPTPRGQGRPSSSCSRLPEETRRPK